MLPKVKESGIKVEDLRTTQIAIYNESRARKSLKLASDLSLPSVSLVAGYNIDQSRRFGTPVNREEQVFGPSDLGSFWRHA